MPPRSSTPWFTALIIGLATALAVGALCFAVIVNAEPVLAPHRSLAWLPLVIAGVLMVVAIGGALAGALMGRRRSVPRGGDVVA